VRGGGRQRGRDRGKKRERDRKRAREIEAGNEREQGWKRGARERRGGVDAGQVVPPAMVSESLTLVRVLVPESLRRPSFPGSVALSSRASKTDSVDDPVDERGQARRERSSN
jgi:hypothetical protein